MSDAELTDAAANDNSVQEPAGTDAVAPDVVAHESLDDAPTVTSSTETAQAQESAATDSGGAPVDPESEDAAPRGDWVDPDIVELLKVPEPPTREEELEKELSELQARLRAVSTAYRKQQDDVAAARVRLEHQAAIKEEIRRGEVVSSLFEPVQNLKRSVDAARKGASMDDTITGLDIVQRQFMSSFEKLGLEEVPGEGARFDPKLHEALTMVPVTDPALDEIVLEVFSGGYRIGNRLIAPARVVVGQLQEPVGEA
jgi:molecular chaperone GrpE